MTVEPISDERLAEIRAGLGAYPELGLDDLSFHRDDLSALLSRLDRAEAALRPQQPASPRAWWDVETERLPDDWDGAYAIVKAAVIEKQDASTAFVQRRFAIGYNRASRYIEQLEQDGVVSAWHGTGRAVLLPPNPTA